MTTKLKCKVYRKGDLVEERTFLDAIVKIGRLGTSHLQLDGIARMHAVLERTGSVWRLIDLGSSMGSKVDGEYVDKTAVLPETGRLGFGDWTLAYEIEDASQELLDKLLADTTRDVMDHEMDTWDSEHHRAMLEGLTGEIRRLSSRAAQQIEETGLERAWASMRTENRRNALRKLVMSVRHLRAETTRHQRQRVASMLEVGPEGILAIYDMTPDQALDHAVDALTTISVAKGALDWLAGMDLVAKSKKAASEDNKTVASIIAGHDRLVDRLQTTMTGGSSLLLAYISRAGGHELTDEERFEMKRAFDEIERASEAANEPSSE